jgi:hypothetical protein
MALEESSMKFARIVFAVAGLYGLVTLVPTYFLETRIGVADPSAITHPEYFYGFLGVALAWQIMFLLIAFEPRRHRPAMLAAFVEKLGFGGAALGLFIAHRIQPAVFALGLVDLALGGLFLISYLATARAGHVARAKAPATPIAARGSRSAARIEP